MNDAKSIWRLIGAVVCCGRSGKHWPLRTGVALTLLLVILISAGTVNAQNPSRFYKVLREVYDNLNETADWLSWSHDAALKMRQGKAPPPSPMSPSIFYEKLQQHQAFISALPLPVFEMELPPDSDLPTGAPGSVRAELRSRVGALLEATAEVQEATAALHYFDLLSESLDSQEQRLHELARVLEDLIDKFPWIPEVLLFTTVDIRESYQPTVSTTAEILARKQKQAQISYEARQRAVLAASRMVIDRLETEGSELESEVDRLRRLDEEVKKLQGLFKSAIEVRDDAREKVNRRENYVNAARLDYQNALERVAGREQGLRDLRSAASRTRELYNEPYKCPESGVDWDTCDNQAHRKYKNQYRDKRERLSEQLRGLERAISEKREALRRAETNVEQAEFNLNSARESLTEARRLLTVAEEKMDEARRQLVAAVEHTNHEKWKSRADVFFQENARDLNSVRFLVETLGGLP